MDARAPQNAPFISSLTSNNHRQADTFLPCSHSRQYGETLGRGANLLDGGHIFNQRSWRPHAAAR
jgi:hypothetical protein